MDYCDQLYRLERQYKHLSPGKRRKAQQKQSKPIVVKASCSSANTAAFFCEVSGGIVF
ncbi:hypothetical protein ACIQT9_23885 [Lysinibacillus xylanilyticus]|uniref:hypothetical protein n=1 Tax=Lysinibacillus xylanilyticus TaxID=582475 RepID=UPI00382B975B